MKHRVFIYSLLSVLVLICGYGIYENIQLQKEVNTLSADVHQQDSELSSMGMDVSNEKDSIDSVDTELQNLSSSVDDIKTRFEIP